jgi:hypothetical protein
MKFAGTTFLIFILFLNPIKSTFSQDEISQAAYLVKSVTLYKICLFTMWPEKDAAKEAFNIIILGQLPKGNKISIPDEKRHKGRKIIIKEIQMLSEIEKCDVLFITSSMNDRLESVLASVKKRPILTFADTQGFAQRGVMVNFYIEEDKVKFELNRREIFNSPLKMSPQIFSIGKNVN